MEIYDLAENHITTDFPPDLNLEKSHLHIGMYLGWVVSRNLYCNSYMNDFKLQLNQFKEREITPIVLSILFIGRVSSEQMDHTVKCFSDYYYRSGKFRKDYTKTFLDEKFETIYHIEESWKNFEKMAEILDSRFEKWKKKKSSAVLNT